MKGQKAPACNGSVRNYSVSVWLLFQFSRIRLFAWLTEVMKYVVDNKVYFLCIHDGKISYWIGYKKIVYIAMYLFKILRLTFEGNVMKRYMRFPLFLEVSRALGSGLKRIYFVVESSLHNIIDTLYNFGGFSQLVQMNPWINMIYDILCNNAELLSSTFH